MASVPVASPYVAAIGPKLAENNCHLPRRERTFRKVAANLTKVPKLGKKAFEQAAPGSSRIRGGKEPLRQLRVHSPRVSPRPAAWPASLHGGR